MIVHGARSDPGYTHLSLDITPEEWQRLQEELLCSRQALLEKAGWTIELARICQGLALRLNIKTPRGGFIMFDRDDPIMLPM